MNDFEETDDEFRERAWATIQSVDESLARPRATDRYGIPLAVMADILAEPETVPEQHELGEPHAMTDLNVRFAKEGLDRDRAIRSAIADFQATVVPAINEALKVLVAELRDDQRKQVADMRAELDGIRARLTAAESYLPAATDAVRDVRADVKEHFAEVRREFESLKRSFAGQDDDPPADPPRLPATRLS